MSEPQPESVIEKVDRAIAWLEALIITVVLTVMVSLATLNLVLHKVFDGGFDWADIIVRQMVLWLGFIGGALATYKGRHIAIDAASKFMPPKLAAATKVVTSLAAMVLALMMLRASVTFLSDEMSEGSKVFADVPAWPFELVIPIAFTAIAFHFFVATYKHLLVALGKREPPPPEVDELEHTHGEAVE